MSSRNVRLNGSRDRALALSRALRAAEDAVAAGERDAARLRELALAAMRTHDVEPEYLELVNTDTLAPVDSIDGETLLAVAAEVGGVRLIDNTILFAAGRH
jgi:pantoate--beta-alanine ligase